MKHFVAKYNLSVSKRLSDCPKNKRLFASRKGQGDHMEHFERTQLIPLRDALNSLMKFVREIPSVGIPQFYCFLDYMKNNIEIYLYAPMDANEWETLFLRLKDILIRDWREANHSVWGIPAFDLLIGERENKTELCLEFLQLVSVIDGFF